jgi:hypothetical protein
MGYAPKRRALDIEYRRSGDFYLYLDVPPQEHAAFMRAESKGTYLNRVFKPKNYRYSIIRHSNKRAVVVHERFLGPLPEGKSSEASTLSF